MWPSAFTPIVETKMSGPAEPPPPGGTPFMVETNSDDRWRPVVVI